MDIVGLMMHQSNDDNNSYLTMIDHAYEKEAIKVRQWTSEATCETPAQSHQNISSVLHFAGKRVPSYKNKRRVVEIE